MKRISAISVLVACLAFVASASASPSPVGGNSTKACGASGTAVVNVRFTLVNDLDSATDGHDWANDTINRQLQIWQVGAGLYCAAVTDQGTFTTYAGTSPGGTGTVSAGVTGKLKGGFVTNVFAGSLNNRLARSGYMGTFVLPCADATFCLSGLSYPSYFDSTTGDQLATWGWDYHTAHNGTWDNTSAGNSGDITG